MALTQRHVGDTGFSDNTLTIDPVVVGVLVYSTAGGNVSLDIGAPGGWGPQTFPTAGITGIVSWSGSDNGIWTS